jgi:hypothetical protein
MSRLIGRERIAQFKLLVPVGINRGERAGGLQFRHLFRRKIPTNRTKILSQLFLVSRADNDGDTLGRCNGQFSAICGTLLPVSTEIASSASTTL